MGEGDAPHDVGYEDLIEAGEPAVPAEPEEVDPAVLMYTGGTTGLPKGVLLGQRAEMLNLYHAAIAVGLGEDRIYLHQTPMFHAASMAASSASRQAAASRCSCRSSSPITCSTLIERYQVNQTVMVPTMIAMLLDDPDFRPSASPASSP